MNDNNVRNWNKELEALMNMSLELLATLDSDSQWTNEEEDKLKRLTKLTAVIGKVQKIVNTNGVEEIDPDEDERIIKNFLARTIKE